MRSPCDRLHRERRASLARGVGAPLSRIYLIAEMNLSIGIAAPVAPEASRGMQRQLQAWAFVVRASVEVIQALIDEIGERERTMERWLRSPKPDPAAIGTLVLEIRARRVEIDRIIGALPTLEGVGETG